VLFTGRQLSSDELRPTLQEIQLRLSVAAGRQLTHGDLAKIAKVNLRSIGEWMRGSIAPASSLALLRLLSALPDAELTVVLKPWKRDVRLLVGRGEQRREPGRTAGISTGRRIRRRQDKQGE
jgi:hypothetical protein